MQFTRFFLICILLLNCLKSSAQPKKVELFITTGANIYLPGKESIKAIYPVIGYNKNTNPNFLIGGFGVAITAMKAVEKNWNSKIQTGFSRNAHWNEYITAVDFVGNDLNNGRNSTINYNFDLFSAFHYRFTKKFSAGTGVGVQVLLASVSRNPFAGLTFGGMREEEKFYLNRYYKTAMPFIPLELSFNTSKLFLNLRYEAALMNKVKDDLANYQQERYGLLNLEVGFRIN